MPPIPRAQYRAPGSRRGASISNLILQRGAIQGRSALASGGIWGNVARDVGDIAGSALQQRQQKREADKQSAAVLDLMQNWDGDPQTAFEGAVRVLGPKDGPVFANGMNAAREIPNARTPEEATALVGPLARALRAAPPGSRQGLWGVLYPMIRDAQLDPDGNLGEEWNEEQMAPILDFYVEGLDPQAPPAPGSPEAFAAMEPGSPEAKAALEQRSAWEEAGRKPETPKAPLTGEAGYIQRTYGDNPTPEQFLEGRRKFAEAGRKPEGPAEADEGYYLAPEGVVLSGLPIGDKNKVQRQAREQGIPAFQTGKQQELGILLAGIHAEALELQGLLKRPDVAMSIGPIMGAVTAGAGRIMELPPKVRRAAQLMYALSDTELRKRSGAQITEAEMKRLLRFVFDPTRPLDHNTQAVEGMLKSASRDYRALSGVDLPGFSPEALPIDPSKGTTVDTSSWNLPGVTVVQRP